jgi:hypothetical protein
MVRYSFSGFIGAQPVFLPGSNSNPFWPPMNADERHKNRERRFCRQDGIV